MLARVRTFVVGTLPREISREVLLRLYALGADLQRSFASSSDFVPGEKVEIVFHKDLPEPEMRRICLSFVRRVKKLEPRFEEQEFS
ncbi:MAG TPA: hypothetical protein PKG74_02465 [Candidatus Colwellbacteria bacterium]|nr:hypothetical protein [Candidatus Colwellbacteria bacterium]